MMAAQHALLVVLVITAFSLSNGQEANISGTPLAQQVLRGSSATLQLAFSALGAANFQPFIDIVIETNALTLSSATYTVTSGSASRTDVDFSSSACVPHPSTKLSTVCPMASGTRLSHFALPYTSFDSSQPAETLILSVNVPTTAILAVDTFVYYRAGFLLGTSPLGDQPPTFSTPGSSSSVSTWQRLTVTPALFTLKLDVPPRMVSGPSFPQSLIFSLDIVTGVNFSANVLEVTLPDRVSFVSVSSSPAATILAVPTIDGFSKVAVNNTVRVRWPTLIGLPGIDSNITLTYFATERDANNITVISNPTSCASVGTFGTASSLVYVINPLTNTTYTQNTIQNNGATTCYTRSTHSRVVSVDNGFSGLSVTDSLDFTVDMSLSDYYALNNPWVSTELSDGHRFDPSFAPRLIIGSTTFMSVNDYTADLNVVDGKTAIIFEVFNYNANLLGPRAFSLRYRTKTLEKYSSTGLEIYHGDKATSTATLRALNGGVNVSFPDFTCLSEATFTMGSPSLSVYAVNGAICSGSCASIFTPKDNVTYRFTYPLPSTDIKQLVFKLYRPFPIFPASLLTFDSVLAGIPGPNIASRGPLSPAFTSNTPTLSTSGSVVTMNFGTFESTPVTTQNIDILATHTIGDFPEFEDSLWTSLVSSSENSVVKSSSNLLAVRLPTLKITLRPVSLDSSAINTGATLTPPCAECSKFCAPGATCSWPNASLSLLTATTVNAISALNKIKFALVVTNIGASAAFDLSYLVSTLPAGLQIPSSGLNGQLFTAAGDLLTPGTDYTLSGLTLTIINVDGVTGGLTGTNGAAGRRTLWFLFDLEVQSDLNVGSANVVSANMSQWSSFPGGKNHVPARYAANSVFESVSVGSRLPTYTSAVATSLAETTVVNSRDLLAVGELYTISYTITTVGGVNNIIFNTTTPVFLRLEEWSVITSGNIATSLSTVSATLTVNTTTITTVNFGAITNTPNGAVGDDDRFILQLKYRAVSGNNGDFGSLSSTLLVSATPNIVAQALNSVAQIGLPQVVATFTFSLPSTVQADSVVPVLLTLSNTGPSPGYGASVTFPLPAGVGLSTVASTSGTPGNGPTITSGISLADTTVAVSWNYISSGSCLVSFSIRLADDIFPGRLFPFSSTLTYNSADNSFGRSLGPTVSTQSFYASNVTLLAPIVISSSDLSATASASEVTIGEIFFWDLSIAFPKGVSPATVLRVNYPTNANSDIFRYRGYSIASDGNLGLGTFTVTPASANANGLFDRVSIAMGTVTNSPAATTSSLILRFEILVLNETTLVEGSGPSVSVAIDSQQPTFPLITASRSFQPVTIRLPVLTMTTAAIPSLLQADAGFQYTLAFNLSNPSATSRSALYDAVITYNLPSKLNFDITAASLSPSNLGTITTSASGLTVEIPTLSLTQSVLLSVPVVIRDTVSPGDAIASSCSVLGYTRNGSIADGASQVRGRAITASTAATTFNVISGTSVTSTATSLPQTMTTNLAIGESVTFTIDLTLIEGVSNYFVNMSIPVAATMPFLFESGLVVSKGVDVSALGLLTASQSIAPSSPDFLRFNLGSISNPGNNVAADVIRLQAVMRVADTIASVRGFSQSIDVRAFFGSAVAVQSSLFPFTIVQPTLTMTRTTSSALTGEGGSVVTFQVDIAHTAASNSAAFQVVFSESLPTGIEPISNSITLTVPQGAISPAPSIISGSSRTDSVINCSIAVISPGSAVRIVYSVLYNSAVMANTPLTSLANLRYDSSSAASGVTGRRLSLSDSKTLDVLDPTVSLTVNSTSLAETSATSAIVDLNRLETVEVIAVISLINGTQPLNLTVRNTGSALLSLLTAEASVVSASSAIDASTLSLIAGAAPTSTTSGIATFIFGSAVINNAWLAASPRAQISVRAVFRADNSLSNTNNLPLELTALLDYGGASVGLAMSTVTGFIREPGLQSTSKCDPKGFATWEALQAGDRFNCTIVVSHNGFSSSAAYNIQGRLNFTAAENLAVVGGSVITNVNPAAGAVTIAKGTGVADDELELSLTVLPYSSTTPFSWTINFDVKVLPSIRPLETVDLKSAQFDYLTVAAGVSVKLLSPSISSKNTGTSTISMFDVGFEGSSLLESASRSATDFDLSVGESANISISVRPFNGTSPVKVKVSHEYAADGSTGQVRVSGFIESSHPEIRGFLISPGSSGSSSDASGSDGVSDTVIFDLGQNVINTGYATGVDADIKFIVTVTPLDSPLNVDGVRFKLNAEFDYGGASVETKSWNGKVVVPELEAAHGCVPLRTSSNWVDVEAGESMRCSYYVNHGSTSTAAAYNVRITDFLPSSLMNLVNGSVIAEVTTRSGQDRPTIIRGNGDDSRVEVLIPNLLKNSTVNITYDVNVSKAVKPGDFIPCQGNATASFTTSKSIDTTANRNKTLSQTNAEPKIGVGAEPTFTVKTISKSLPYPAVDENQIKQNVKERSVIEIEVRPIQGSNPLNITVSQRDITNAEAFIDLGGNVTSVGPALRTVSNLTQLQPEKNFADGNIDKLTFRLDNVVNEGFLEGLTNSSIKILVVIDVPNIGANDDNSTFSVSVDVSSTRSVQTKSLNGTITEPRLASSYDCAPNQDWSSFEAGKNFNCSLVIQNNGTDTVSMNLNVLEEFPTNFVSLLLLPGFEPTSSIDRATISTVNDTFAASLPYLLPSETWVLNWTGFVNEQVRPAEELFVPTNSLTFTFSSSDDPAGRLGAFSISNSSEVSVATRQPTWDFFVSPDSVTSGNSERDLIALSIGESVELTVDIFPIQGTTISTVRIVHEFGNGTNGLFKLAGSIETVSNGLSSPSLTSGSDGVLAVVGGREDIPNAVDFDMGAVVNRGFYGDEFNQTIRLRVSVLPINDTVNIKGTQFIISAIFNDGVDTRSITIPGFIQEQFLQYRYSCDPSRGTWTVVSGDRINCTATVEHLPDSRSAAFQLNYTDASTNPFLEIVPGSFTSNLPINTSFNNSTGTNSLSLRLNRLELTEQWTFSFLFEVTDLARPLSSFSPLFGRLVYQSFGGNDSRVYIASRVVTNDVRATVDVPEMSIALVSDRVLNTSFTQFTEIEIVLGETLVFEATIIPKPGTSSLTFTAAHQSDLSAGIVALNGSVFFIDELLNNATLLEQDTALTFDFFNNDGVNETVVFNLGGNIASIAYRSDVTPGTIVLSISITVANLVSNSRGVSPSILFSLDYDNGGSIDIPVSLLLVEPELFLADAVVPSSGLLVGQDVIAVSGRINHSIASNSPAYDIFIEVSMPTNDVLQIQPGSVLSTGGSVFTNTSLIRLSIPALPIAGVGLGIFNVEVTSSVSSGDNLSFQSFKLVYFSAPSSLADSRRRYEINLQTYNYSVPMPTIQMALASSNASCATDCAVTISSLIEVEVVFEVTRGSSNYSITIRSQPSNSSIDLPQNIRVISASLVGFDNSSTILRSLLETRDNATLSSATFPLTNSTFADNMALFDFGSILFAIPSEDLNGSSPDTQMVKIVAILQLNDVSTNVAGNKFDVVAELSYSSTSGLQSSDATVLSAVVSGLTVVEPSIGLSLNRTLLSSVMDSFGIVESEIQECSITISHLPSSTSGIYNISLNALINDPRATISASTLRATGGSIINTPDGFILVVDSLALGDSDILIIFEIEIFASSLGEAPKTIGVNMSFFGLPNSNGREYSLSIPEDQSTLSLFDQNLAFSIGVVTSLDSTSGFNLTIGETVTFTIAVYPPIPTEENTSIPFAVQVAISNEGTILYRGFTVNIGSSIIGDNVSSLIPSEISNNDTYRILELNLGDIDVIADVSGRRNTNQLLVVEFSVLASDLPSYVSGQETPIIITFLSNGTLTESTVSFELIEPSLDSSAEILSSSSALLKPGSKVDTSVTFEHFNASTSDAYDVLLLVAVPDGVKIDFANITSNANGTFEFNTTHASFLVDQFSARNGQIKFFVTSEVLPGVFAPRDKVVSQITQSYTNYNSSEADVRSYSSKLSFQLGEIADLFISPAKPSSPSQVAPFDYNSASIPVSFDLEVPRGTRAAGQILILDLGSNSLAYNPLTPLTIAFSGSFTNGSYTVTVENNGTKVIITLNDIDVDPNSNESGLISVTVPTQFTPTTPARVTGSNLKFFYSAGPSVTFPLLNVTEVIVLPFTIVYGATDEDVPLQIPLAWYPSVLNFSIVNGSKLNSTVTLSVNGSVLLIDFASLSDVNGRDVFTLLIFVDKETFQFVQVVIDINPISDAPVIVDDYFSEYDFEYRGIAAWPLLNDRDADNDLDPDSFQIYFEATDDLNITVYANFSEVVVVLTSKSLATGNASAIYTVCDITDQCGNATIYWNWTGVDDFTVPLPLKSADVCIGGLEAMAFNALFGFAGPVLPNMAWELYFFEQFVGSALLYTTNETTMFNDFSQCFLWSDFGYPAYSKFDTETAWYYYVRSRSATSTSTSTSQKREFGTSLEATWSKINNSNELVLEGLLFWWGIASVVIVVIYALCFVLPAFFLWNNLKCFLAKQRTWLLPYEPGVDLKAAKEEPWKRTDVLFFLIAIVLRMIDAVYFPMVVWACFTASVLTYSPALLTGSNVTLSVITFVCSVAVFPAYLLWWFLNKGSVKRLYGNRNVAAMGSFYLMFTKDLSFWYVIKLALRFLEAVLIGSFFNYGWTLLIGIIIIEVAYFAVVLWKKPFVKKFPFYVELGLTAAKAVLAILLLIMITTVAPVLELICIILIIAVIIGYTIAMLIHFVMWIIHYRKKYNEKKSEEEVSSSSSDDDDEDL